MTCCISLLNIFCGKFILEFFLVSYIIYLWENLEKPIPATILERTTVKKLSISGKLRCQPSNLVFKSGNLERRLDTSFLHLDTSN